MFDFIDRVTKSKVFIVEDDRELAEAYAGDIKINGDKDPVSFIRDYDDFSNAVLDGGQYRAFVVDIHLGIGKEREGIEIIEGIRKRFPDALIIAHTAYSDTEAASRRAGANYFFLKEDYLETMKKISMIINDRKEEAKKQMPTILFYATAVHVDPEQGVVKMDCFMGNLACERYFRLQPITTAIKEPLQVNTALEVRVMQKEMGIMIEFKKLDQIPGRSAPDWLQSKNGIDLTQSTIWINELKDGD